MNRMKAGLILVGEAVTSIFCASGVWADGPPTEAAGAGSPAKLDVRPAENPAR